MKFSFHEKFISCGLPSDSNMTDLKLKKIVAGIHVNMGIFVDIRAI